MEAVEKLQKDHGSRFTAAQKRARSNANTIKKLAHQYKQAALAESKVEE
jgi:hypothetical protein